MIGDVGGGRPDEGGVGALGGVEHHTPRGGEPEAATGGVVGAARQAARETLRTSEIIFLIFVFWSLSQIHRKRPDFPDKNTCWFRKCSLDKIL